MKLLNKIKDALNQETFNLNNGIGHGINQLHSCSKSMVTVNGVRLVVMDGLIKVNTGNKPYTVVVDGEVIRRQVG